MDGTKFPKGLLLAKPRGSEAYKESAVYELEQQERLIVQRKHDGYKLIAIKGSDGTFRIWTVGGKPVHERLPHVVQYLRHRPIPVGTVLVGEGLMLEGQTERFEWTAKVFQGGDESGARAQASYGPASLRIFQAFDLDELNGPEHRTRRPYRETLARLYEYVGTADQTVSTVQTLTGEYDAAKRQVAREDWEGLVLTDTQYRLAWRLDGKKGAEPRPKGCYKYKPLTEDDFFVTARGRIWHEDGRLKEVILCQREPGSGEVFSCGKLGTFKADDRKRLAVKRLKTTVLQVAFERRNPDTGKLRFARFMRFRRDKFAESCIAPGSYPKSERV